MNVGEILKMLITAPNYNLVRGRIDDSFINFIKDMLPSDYGYIEEKEKAYQETLKAFKELK
jgi:hypothetical protein